MDASPVADGGAEGDRIHLIVTIAEGPIRRWTPQLKYECRGERGVVDGKSLKIPQALATPEDP